MLIKEVHSEKPRRQFSRTSNQSKPQPLKTGTGRAVTVSLSLLRRSLKACLDLADVELSRVVRFAPLHAPRASSRFLSGEDVAHWSTWDVRCSHVRQRKGVTARGREAMCEVLVLNANPCMQVGREKNERGEGRQRRGPSPPQRWNLRLCLCFTWAFLFYATQLILDAGLVYFYFYGSTSSEYFFPPLLYLYI